LNNRNDILNGLKGHSIAMYSTWFWNRHTRSMFDAGEGISMAMRNHVFAIENVFLSHGHHDHIGGLSGLALARGAARGDKEKPFTVFHPGGWSKIDFLKTYIRAAASDLEYELVWQSVEPDQDIPVSDDKKTVIRPFRVNHSKHLLCLGYAMIEKRVRLRKEFAGLPGKEIAALAAKNGKNSISEAYEKLVMAYSGDCTPINPSVVRDADVLFHEATFVGDGDMDPSGGHSTVRGAVRTASDANVGALVLFHLSVRYTVEDAVVEARKAASDYGFSGKIQFVFGHKTYDVVG